MNLYTTKIIEEIRTTDKKEIIVAQSKLTKLEKEVITKVAKDNKKTIAFVTMNKFLEYKNNNYPNVLVIE